MADSVDPRLSKSTSEEDWLKKLSEILSEVKKGLPASTVLALADDYSSMSEAEYLERLGLAPFGTYGMIVTDQKQDVEPFPLSNALVKTVGSSQQKTRPFLWMHSSQTCSPLLGSWCVVAAISPQLTS
jgi:hypothetical protein